jgi:hypothetical protein
VGRRKLLINIYLYNKHRFYLHSTYRLSQQDEVLGSIRELDHLENYKMLRERYDATGSLVIWLKLNDKFSNNGKAKSEIHYFSQLILMRTLVNKMCVCKTCGWKSIIALNLCTLHLSSYRLQKAGF